MKSYEEEMIKVLNVLNESGALPHCVISGSWAMYFYKTIFNDFVPRVETTDIDIYLPNPKKANGQSLTEKFNNQKYIRNDDSLSGKTTFLSATGFSVEFLTIPDRTLSHTIKVKDMSIVAEALPKMAPAGWNYINIEWNGLKVNIVSPVSFVLQKLLINSERNSEYKKEKDLDAIKYVLAFVKASKKYNDELKRALETYPKKWVKIILNTAKEKNIEL